MKRPLLFLLGLFALGAVVPSNAFLIGRVAQVLATTLYNWTDAATGVTVGGTPLSVDCTGSADATSTMQAAFTANPSAHIMFPLGCKVKISSTITITDGQGATLESTQYSNGDVGGGESPELIWYGTNGGATCNTFSDSNCVYMFWFDHVDHPMVRNLTFGTAGSSNCPDGFLLFDGAGGSHIGTHGRINDSTFNNGNCANNNFVGVNISPISTTNYENFSFDNDYITCSNSQATYRAKDGNATGGSTTLTSATAAFVTGDTGKRIRVSWAGQPAYSNGALVDTTMTYVSATQVTLGTAPSSTSGNAWGTQTTATIITDGSHGQGIAVATPNASYEPFNTEIKNLSYYQCAIGINLYGGSGDIINPNGGHSDIGIQIGESINRGTMIQGYQAEGDVVGFNLVSPVASVPITIKDGYFTDDFMNANGFIMDGAVDLVLIGNGAGDGNGHSMPNATNSELLGVNGTSTTTVVSIGNYFNAFSWAGLGYNNFTSPPTSINDTYSALTSLSLLSSTIANLPICGFETVGLVRAISNGVASPAYRGAVSTTGSTWQEVTCDGTNWLYH